MRKCQEKILKKAEKYNFSQEKKAFLSRNDFNIAELEFTYDILRLYRNPDYQLLEQIVRNKQCQQYKYSFWTAMNCENPPQMEDLYAVFKNRSIPDDQKGIAICYFLGKGWSYSDCCRIFEQYQNEMTQGFNNYYTGILTDYINMSHKIHQPFKIGFRSVKKIEDAHGQLPHPVKGCGLQK